MVEDQAREDIAFIRRAIEEGGAYATHRSPDMLVWGIAVAIGYLATYSFIRGWSPIGPNTVWTVCVILPWLYSLRRVVSRTGCAEPARRRPMAQALAMLWLALGIFITITLVLAMGTGAVREGWSSAVTAGAVGVGFFASSWLGNLPWLRWVGAGWWLGELVLFALRHELEALPLAAALYLLLLAGPGYVLWSQRGGHGRRMNGE
jgi:hypothetical protein